MKVFILVCDWVWSFEPDMDVQVFKTLESAICSMRAEAENFKNTEGIMRKLDVLDYHDYYISFSEDGCWQENHIAWTIYERELKK